ncbi:MAG TPA: PQQ-binding-like beta-propeller repeat protein [Acidimicrobiia bacterium]
MRPSPPWPRRPRVATVRGRTTATWAALLLAALAVLPLTATAAGAAPLPWPTYHGDPTRQGAPGPVPALTPAHHTWTSPVLDGMVYGEPVVDGPRVYVVTENDSFYALDATTGQIVWRTHVGTPVPLRLLPCGNIDPLGITGTPVIEPGGTVIYAIAEELTPAIHHQLVGVDTRTGNVVVNRNADPPGADPRTHQQRAALALNNGRVYWAFGGLSGDCGAYHGWVMGSATNGTGALLHYMVPTPREGAIWATSGIAIDSGGNLVVATGNGQNGPGQPYDHGNSVVKLSPTLTELGAFGPTSWAVWSAEDADLGSMGPALVGPGNGDAFVVGKQQVAFLVDELHLSGTHVGDANALADLAMPGCAAFGGSAYDSSTSIVYVPCASGIRAVHIDFGVSPPTMAAVGTFHGPAANGSPIVAGGAVWVTNVDAGILYALNPSTGATLATFGIGHARHFTSTAAVGGRLFVAGDTRVFAFAAPGVNPPAPVRGYTVDAFGAVHPYGGAPAVRTSAYWRGWDIARGVALRRDNSGVPHGGYVLDGWGGVHAFGGAPPSHQTAYWRGWDIARAITTNPCDATGDSGYVLDGWGGVHPYGGAPTVRLSAFFRGADVARGLALEPCSGNAVRGEVVDAFGGVHPLVQTGHTLPAPPRSTGRWPVSLTRGAVGTAVGQGLVLDAFGGLHPYGGAVNAFASGYWPSRDIVRGLMVVPGTSEGYVVDAFGALHGYGGAPPVSATGYWLDLDIVRGVA